MAIVAASRPNHGQAVRYKRDAADGGPANAWDAQSYLVDPARDQSLLGPRSVEKWGSYNARAWDRIRACQY